MFTDKNLEHLRAIFEVYDKPFTKNIAKIYASCLSAFDEEAIEKGLDLASASSKFLPKPVDIIDCIKKAYKVDDESLELRASGVYEELVRKCSNISPYTSIVFADKRAFVAFKFVFGDGYGASQILADNYQSQAMRKEFIKAYMRVKTLKDFEPVVFAQSTSLERNYVVFIGDKDKCEHIAKNVFKRYVLIDKNVNMRSIENKCKVDEKIFDDMLSSLSNFFGVLNVK